MADSKPKAVKVTPPPEPAAAKPKAKSTKEKPTGKPVGRPPELQKQLENLFMMTGLMVGASVDEFDGEVIAENAEALAEAWTKLAQQNAAVKRILESLMETSAWGGVIATTAAVAIPIAQHHGAIPANVPHPFKKSPRVEAAPVEGSQQGPVQRVPPQQGSPIAPSQARTPPEPPPGQHKHGTG